MLYRDTKLPCMYIYIVAVIKKVSKRLWWNSVTVLTVWRTPHAGGARQGHAPFVLFVIWISKIEIIFHFDFLISFFLWVDVIPSSTFIEHGGIGEIWHFWLFYFFLTCLCVWRVDSVSAWLRYLLSGVGRLSAISKQSKSTMHSVIISIKSTVITLVFSSNITSLQTMIYWVCYLRRTGGGPFLAEISRPVNV